MLNVVPWIVLLLFHVARLGRQRSRALKAFDNVGRFVAAAFAFLFGCFLLIYATPSVSMFASEPMMGLAYSGLVLLCLLAPVLLWQKTRAEDHEDRQRKAADVAGHLDRVVARHVRDIERSRVR